MRRTSLIRKHLEATCSYKYFAPPELHMIHPLLLAVVTRPHRTLRPSSLNRRNPIYDNLRHGRNNLALVGVIDGERDQHELSAICQFYVRRVVARRASPSRFRPELHAGHPLQGDPREAMPLIVIIFGRARVIALQ